MTNMSYCRFENTLRDLLDCEEHIDDELDIASEIKAREQLLKVCSRLAPEEDDE